MIKSSSISCSYTTLNILQIKILLSFAKVNYYFSSQLDVALRLSIVNLPNYSILSLTFHIKPLIIFLKMFEIHFSISLRQRTFNLFCANCLRILLINIGLRYQHEGIWNTQLEWIFFSVAYEGVSVAFCEPRHVDTLLLNIITRNESFYQFWFFWKRDGQKNLVIIRATAILAFTFRRHHSRLNVIFVVVSCQRVDSK
jgi:hypothetical protein